MPVRSRRTHDRVCDDRAIMTDRTRAWPFLAAAGTLVGVFTCLYLLFVRSFAGQVIDERAKVGAAIAGPEFARLADRLLDPLPVVCAAIGVPLVIAVGLLRRQFRLLAIALGVVLGANLSTELLKHVLLYRPATGATEPIGNSFPSGHETLAASLVFALFLVAAPRLRPVVAATGCAFSVAVGALLLASQWHRPSDVVGALTMVAIWGCLAGAAAVRLGVPLRGPRAGAAGVPVLWILAGCCAVVATFALVMLSQSIADRGRHTSLAFVGGLAAVTSAGAALTAAASRLFHRFA